MLNSLKKPGPTKWIVLSAAVAMAGVLLYLTADRPNRAGACKELVSACEQAGFKLGSSAQERREFRSSCMRPILQTGSFRGHDFDPSIISACKARFERRRQKMGEGRPGGAGGGGADDGDDDI
jgi:hypothetical protein